MPDWRQCERCDEERACKSRQKADAAVWLCGDCYVAVLSDQRQRLYERAVSTHYPYHVSDTILPDPKEFP